jgi:hypothetical protein
MNIKKPVKFLGFSYASAAETVRCSALLLMSILLLLSSAILLLPTIQSAFADSYTDGYNEGCYDAGRDFKGLKWSWI